MKSPGTAIVCLLGLMAVTHARAQSAVESARRHFDAGIEASIQGRHKEAIAEFEATLAIDPASTEAVVNLACENALLGDVDRGLTWLQRAAETGYASVAVLLVSDGLAPLREDGHFRAILDRVRANERAAAASSDSTRVERAEANRQELERSNEIARLSPVLWRDGPTQAINQLTFSPDGEVVVTWGVDGIIRAWNPWTGEPIGEFGRHQRSDVSVSFSPDGQRVFVFDYRCGRATLFDGLSGEVLGRVGDDSSVFDEAVVSSDGRIVATLDQKGNVRLWTVASGAPALRTSCTGLGANRIQFSPGGAHLLLSCRDLVARVVDVETGAVLATIGTERHPVGAAFYTADGQRIVTRTGAVKIGVWSTEKLGQPLLWVSDHERAVAIESRVSPNGSRLVTPAVTRGAPGTELILWDVEAGSPLQRLDGMAPLANMMAFSSDGTRFANGRRQAGWRLWDARTGKVVASQSETDVSLLLFSPDSRTIAVRTEVNWGIVKTYDARTGEAIRTASSFDASVRTVAFSPDSERLASAGILGYGEIAFARNEETATTISKQARRAIGFRFNPRRSLVLSTHLALDGETRSRTARLWSSETGLPVQDYDAFDKFALTADFSPDGHRLLLAGRSRAGAEWIRIVDVATGATVSDLSDNEDCFDARFSADGTRILATCRMRHAPPDPGEVKLWDAIASRLIVALPAGVAPNNWNTPAAVFSPDGSRIASWSAAGTGAVNLSDGRTGALLRTLQGHRNDIRHLSFSPDGTDLVTTSWDGSAKLWDVETGAMWADFPHGDAVWHACFDPSGQRLATACFSGAATVFDLTGRSEPKVLSHSRGLRVVRFSPDGKKLATGGENGWAYLWDTGGDWSRTSLDGHDAAVEEAEFTPDGRRLLTMAEDGTTRVWDVATGRLLLTRVLYAEGNWLAFEPHGYYAGSPAAADWARIVVKGRTFPLSSYAKILESKEKIAASLAGAEVPAPSQLPSAPLLELVSPASGEIAEDSFRLEAFGHDDYGIETVTVLQDGVPLDSKVVVAALVQSQGGRTVRLSLPLAFPAGRSATTVVVRAENRRHILSRPVSVHLRHARPKRELYVLALGVGDYDKDSMDLSCPTKDVSDLTSLLVGQDGSMYDKVHVQALTDREVSLKVVRRLRDDFLLRARPEDTIIVFAAGHGIRTLTNEYFFLTSDSTADDPYGGIARKDLEELVSWEKLHARKRVLLIDTCHSGASARTRGATPLFGPEDQARLDESVREGIYVIAASADDEFAREQEGNGIFTRALLDGLAGGADSDGNGYVEIEELKAYAGRQVHERSGGRQVPTFPKVEAGENFRLAKVLSANGR